MENKSKSCARCGWDFAFHVTETEGLLEETGNPRQETKNAEVYSSGSAHILRKMFEARSLGLRLHWNFDYRELGCVES